MTLRGDDGEQRTIPLVDLRAEAEEVGAPLPFAPAPAIVTLDEHEEDIVLEEAVVAERVVILGPLDEGGPRRRWTGGPARPRTGRRRKPTPSDDPPIDQSTGPTASRRTISIKRPRRRRGRRGGRRNRPGGGGSGGPSRAGRPTARRPAAA